MFYSKFLSWALKTAAGAVIGGVCWKLGADLYEKMKEKVGKPTKPKDAASEASEGAGPIQTHTVGAENGPRPGTRVAEA
jgi:hypothetical protein